MLEIAGTVAQFAGLPGLLVLYLIIRSQRQSDKDSRAEEDKVMSLRIKHIEEKMASSESDLEQEQQRIEKRFENLEAKVDDNHKELNDKLDKMNEAHNASFAGIKDLLTSIDKNVAIMKAERDTEKRFIEK